MDGGGGGCVLGFARRDNEPAEAASGEPGHGNVGAVSLGQPVEYGRVNSLQRGAVVDIRCSLDRLPVERERRATDTSCRRERRFLDDRSGHTKVGQARSVVAVVLRVHRGHTIARQERHDELAVGASPTEVKLE